MIATIHTYGHIDSIFYVLNAIAALTKTSTIMPLIQAMCMLASCYYAVKMAYGENSHQNRQYLLKTFGMLIIINLAIVPKTSMIIRDHITKHQEKVDNLPYGFVVPVAVLEHFGDVLTRGFEQVFQVVGAKGASYRDYGMVFGARLIKESRNFRIKNPEFAENMDNFIKRCVIREAMIGKNYTPEQLLKSSDIWSLAKRHASRLRQVPIRVKNDRKLMPCAITSRVIESSFTGEIASLNEKYSKSDFSLAGMDGASRAPEALQSLQSSSSNSRLNQILSTNIQNAFSSQIGLSGKSAESIIRQQMMINAMHNFSDNYGFVRASATQESSWRLSGDLSTIYLPMLLTVMKGIFYASFIFLLPLMLLSGGAAKYLGYLSIIASLQLWPALNSILNMFIDLYSVRALPSISGGIISFTTSGAVGDYADKIVAVASGLQMVIPFLAFGVIQGGVSGFMNIAGTITGATSSAATSAAHEVTTGNRSLDNISIANVQKEMRSGFKTDLNSSFASNASSYQHIDGTVEKTLPDGDTIYSSGAGITTSSGATNVETRNIASSEASNTYSVLESMAKSSGAAYTDSETATMNHSLNSLVSLSKQTSAGISETIDTNSSESRITQQAQNYMRHLRDTFGYTHEQAAAAYLKGSLDLEITAGKGANSSEGAARSMMSSFLGSLLPRAALGGGTGGSFTASNNDTQSLSDETGSSIDNSHIVAYSTLETALSSEHYATSDTKDKTLADDLRASRERTNQLARTAEMRSEDLRSFGDNITNSDTKEVIITHESRDEIVNQISRSENMHPLEAHRSLERGDAPAHQSLKAKALTAKQDTEDSMQSAKQYFVGSERDQALSEFGEENRQKVNSALRDNIAETEARSASEGMTKETNEKATEDIKTKIDAKASLVNTKASDALKIKAKAIQMEYDEYRDKVREAEHERKTSRGRKNNNS